jgi:hypothetical protein
LQEWILREAWIVNRQQHIVQEVGKYTPAAEWVGEVMKLVKFACVQRLKQQAFLHALLPKFNESIFFDYIAF